MQKAAPEAAFPRQGAPEALPALSLCAQVHIATVMGPPGLNMDSSGLPRFSSPILKKGLCNFVRSAARYGGDCLARNIHILGPAKDPDRIVHKKLGRAKPLAVSELWRRLDPRAFVAGWHQFQVPSSNHRAAEHFGQPLRMLLAILRF